LRKKTEVYNKKRKRRIGKEITLGELEVINDGSEKRKGQRN